MERIDDEALCRCGAWVPVAILRDCPRVQFSASGVLCLECRNMEIHVGYNWIARQVVFVKYRPLSDITKPVLRLPPRLYVVRVNGDRKSDAIKKQGGAQVPRRRGTVSPLR